MRDLEIHQEIMKTVDEYTGLNGSAQPRYELYPYPQRLGHLSANLRQHILRESGDIKRYLTLQQEVFDLCPGQVSSDDRAIYSIAQWLDGQLDNLSYNPVSNALVIGLLVFGESYLNKLINYTLPSLLTLGNLAGLALEKTVILYIQTDAAGKQAIGQAAGPLKSHGVQFQYVIMPDALVAQLKNPDVNYWMLGANASLSLQYAKSIGAAFHHAYPDLVYSEKFFIELHRLSKEHKVIVGSGMRSDETLMIPMLEGYRVNNTISIPSADLMAHHLNCIHQCAWGMMVNNRPGFWHYPMSHILVWESDDTVHFNSPHVMPHWLSAEVVATLSPRYYTTLDSEMDLVTQGHGFYMVGEEDEVYQVELSPPNRQWREDIYTNAQGAAELLWKCVSHRDTAKFYFKDMKVRLNRKLRPTPANVMPKVQVEAMQVYLYNTIAASDPYAGVKLARGRSHSGILFR